MIYDGELFTCDVTSTQCAPWSTLENAAPELRTSVQVTVSPMIETG